MRGFVTEKRVVEVTVMHEVINEEKTASFWVGGESDGGDHKLGAKARGEEEFVVELALALERSGVHEFNGDGASGKGAREDRAEAAVAEAGGEGVGGAAEEGVSVGVRGVGVGIGGRGGAFAFAEAEEE